MFMIFLMTCLSGSPECYSPASDAGNYYTYPDKANCEADRDLRNLGERYICLPVKVLHLDNENERN